MSGFRERARQWLATNAPTFPTGDPYDVARQVQRRIHDAGFAGITWPEAYGGQGLSAEEKLAWDEEAQEYDLPVDVLGIGLHIVGSILLELGTEEQKQRHLAGLGRGDLIGCQLFSEPGAGSDVASLRTRAVRDDEGWLVNGQKVWTSHAHRADFGILLARTNPDVPKHQGITMFVLDMSAPGVTVRPLRDMTGAVHFNEVFLEDVRLPGDAVVGQVDEGWQATARMLRYERLAIAGRRQSRDDAASTAALATAVREAGRETDPVVRRTLAEVFVAEKLGELLGVRLSEEIKAGADPGPRGSVGKLAESRRRRLVAQGLTTLVEARATAWEPDDKTGAALAGIVTGAPRYRIAGGTDEIQRTILGERVLGLPKGPS